MNPAGQDPGTRLAAAAGSNVIRTAKATRFCWDLRTDKITIRWMPKPPKPTRSVRSVPN